MLPAHKISDHIGMAYDNINGVFLLINVGPVKVLPESCFNSGSFLIELLREIHSNRTHNKHCYIVELTYRKAETFIQVVGFVWVRYYKRLKDRSVYQLIVSFKLKLMVQSTPSFLFKYHHILLLYSHKYWW